MMHRYLSGFLGVCVSWATFAQTPKSIVKGVVIDAETQQPLEGVVLQNPAFHHTTLTTREGQFQIVGNAGDSTLLTARLLGYEPAQQWVSSIQTSIVFRLQPTSLSLKEVRVSAQELSLGSGSNIGRQAIQHVQPVSLADILQLIPGQLAGNPDLNTVQQSLLRQVATNAAADRMNALGTALILDGVPLSNNANLQTDVTILNAAPGTQPPFASAAGRGNDLRQIPADHIESVEVIRGIPSVRFGDLTTGGLLVTTRAGVYKPRITQKLNPSLSQTSVGYGVRAGRLATLSLDTDLAFSRSDPRDFLDRFSRWSNQLTATRTDGTISNTLRLLYTTTLDQLRKNPDAQDPFQQQYARDQAVRVNFQGSWRPLNQTLRSLSYTLGYSRSRQVGFYQNLVTRDVFPLSTARTDTTQVGEYGKSEYLNQTHVDGRPVNVYGRIESSWFLKTGSLTHKPVVGSEWRTEVNRGLGRQFDVRTPPRQNYSMGDRPRSYAEIPALHQWSAYLEDQLSIPLRNRSWIIQAGVRLDQVSVVQNGQRFWQPSWAPRLNTSLEIIPKGFLRAGYGHMNKAPTLSYLYPNPTYFDLVNFNYFATNPAERLVVLTTRKIVPDTRSLKAFQTKKWEVGFDWNRSRQQLQLTYFRETTDHAFRIARDLMPLLYGRYEAQSMPGGAPPVLATEPYAYETFMAPYDRPQADVFIRNQGLEFTWERNLSANQRTSLNLTGAWIRTKTGTEGLVPDSDRAIFSSQRQDRIAMYQPNVSVSERLNTSLRLIYRIPSLQLVASALVQTVWLEKNRYTQRDSLASGYLTTTGQQVLLTRQQATSAEYASLRRGVNPAELSWQTRPPLWLFNFRLTKEWQRGSGFAFYVNNVFSSKPTYYDIVRRYPVQRSQPTLFFGVELFYSL
ncbi:outer membrane receptor protein [Siphonobacter sp. BAB-5405]|uniref:TonB-dependent receptor n=1 Tax=Siphonobacter sp. BAB-5405 TaxID=1864825 RepID=UPI000C808018|nr:TonB-dependent receptor [Siphonobacter sp. BAB-5405]PMD99134.1 outer membrane receptor protein [Siphonobacter sp. BAB-5405]